MIRIPAPLLALAWVIAALPAFADPPPGADPVHTPPPAWSERLALRTEARYRLGYEQDYHFHDYVIGIGVQWSFGASARGAIRGGQ